MSIGGYIGIPWIDNGSDFEGCHCWGLVQLYYREEYGIQLPDLTQEQAEKSSWCKVIPGEAHTGDVVLLRGDGAGTRHVGIAISNNDMLHVEQGSFACIESFRGLRWKDRLLKIYRYKPSA